MESFDLRKMDIIMKLIARIPRSSIFTAYEIENFPSQIKSRVLGILHCFRLLKRKERFRRSYKYEPTPIFSKIPTSTMGWLYTISHAATMDYLHSLLDSCEKKKPLPKPVLGYLYYDILKFLRSFFVIDKNRELTPFGRVLYEARGIIKRAMKGDSFAGKTAFEIGAALLLKHLLIFDDELSEDFVKIYASALIACSVNSSFLNIDSLGTISVRVEQVLEVFEKFFKGSGDEFFRTIRKFPERIFIEADKTPGRMGFLVISPPKVMVRGCAVNVK